MDTPSSRPIDVVRASQTKRRSELVEQALARLADRQHGVVAAPQLRALGIDHGAIRHRLRLGRLRRLHRGVYAVGHGALTADGLRLAAVLAAGEGAVLARRSAAALWGVRPCGRSQHEVIVPPGRRGRPTVTVYRTPLHSDEVTRVHGIPVTTVARTLLDLAALGLPRRHIERACDRAEELRIFDLRAVQAVLARAGARAGTPLLRQVLETYEIGAPTNTELEAIFYGAVVAAGLPRPQRRMRMDFYPYQEVDFLWPERRLVVEVDGFAVHGTRQAFERDRRRDRRLVLHGYRVVGFTWHDVTADIDGVLETMQTLLGA
jgi:very-short-patch-repair endonuclease/predicted transcriptional regulator of viral defense system